MSQSDKDDIFVTNDNVEFIHFDVLELYCKIWSLEGLDILTSVNDDIFVVLVYNDNIDQLEPLKIYEPVFCPSFETIHTSPFSIPVNASLSVIVSTVVTDIIDNEGIWLLFNFPDESRLATPLFDPLDDIKESIWSCVLDPIFDNDDLFVIYLLMEL